MYKYPRAKKKKKLEINKEKNDYFHKSVLKYTFMKITRYSQKDSAILSLFFYL